MESGLFEKYVKNIANRYNEEISKMVLSGTPMSPQMLDAIWKKHCTPHVDAMYGMIGDNVQQMMNNVAHQIHTDFVDHAKRTTISEVECTSDTREDGIIKVGVGLKIGSRYVGHNLGYTIDTQSGNIFDKFGNIVNNYSIKEK